MRESNNTADDEMETAATAVATFVMADVIGLTAGAVVTTVGTKGALDTPTFVGGYILIPPVTVATATAVILVVELVGRVVTA